MRVLECGCCLEIEPGVVSPCGCHDPNRELGEQEQRAVASFDLVCLRIGREKAMIEFERFVESECLSGVDAVSRVEVEVLMKLSGWPRPRLELELRRLLANRLRHLVMNPILEEDRDSRALEALVALPTDQLDALVREAGGDPQEMDVDAEKLWGRLQPVVAACIDISKKGQG